MAELPVPVAPIAPDPPVPVASAPVKVTTVMEAETLCDRVAVTVALVTIAGAKARQISDVPSWVLVRFTIVQVRLPPVMLETVIPAPVASLETNASSNSLALVVVNAGETRLVLAVLRSVEAVLSIANCAVEVKFTAVTLAPLTVTALFAGAKM